MLSLVDVRKEYGEGDGAVVALRSVSLSFRENEFVSILGPSGCGKTTLLNIIGGLDHYTSGDLVIRGVSTKLYRDADWDAYRNHSVGFVFQSYNLIPHQSVLSNVELALTLSGVSRAERRRRAMDALTKVGLGDQMKKRPNQLSGGQMQRVAIARALVNDPDILLADEPTGALDTETSVQVMDLLREVAREKLVVMVTHNPDLAEQYSTRIIRLLDGEIVGDTDPFVPTLASAAEETVSEGASAEKQKKPKKEKKAKKRSMSFFTALSLSLNNLMTKKGRTFLTSFAGSIGIIGIALILALSNGINNYIYRVQEDSLSSYPITINREETDLMSMIASLGEQRKESRNHEVDDKTVYSNAVMYNLINTLLAPDKSENNLAAFKKFIDDGAFDDVNATVQYGYDIPLIVYTQDPATGNYISSDIYALMTNANGSDASSYSFSSAFSSYSVWGEVLGGANGEKVADLVKEQYDLLEGGSWPSKVGDVLLVVNDYNEVNDLTLYALGLKSEEDMKQLITAAMRGQKIEQPETQSWSTEELLNITFRTIVPARLYEKNEHTGKWESIANDQQKLNSHLTTDDSIEMRICGVIRKKPDATAGSASGTLLYTAALTDYLIESTESSPIVVAQRANPEIDVLTGKPFEVEEDPLPDDKDEKEAEKAARIKAYVAGLSTVGKATFLKTLLTTDYDSKTDTVKNLDTRVLTIVTNQMQTIGSTREKLVAWIEQNYPEYAAYVSASDSEALLRKTVMGLLSTRVLQQLTAEGEQLYETYRNTPSEAEVTARANEITATLADRAAKERYAVKFYLDSTQLSREALENWAAGLSDDELDEVVGRLAAEQATGEIAAIRVDEETKDQRCADALDKIVAGWSQTNLASAYVYFYRSDSAGTTLAETLARLYVCDKDVPSRISIYVTTFAEKDKVTDIIEQYNADAEEDDQIKYTDYMALLMSALTRILDAVTYVLVAFVSVSLVVSSIMIGIITYISVLERTKEIGILRAMGGSKRDVSRVFNAETLIIGFSAGLIGILVTLLLCIPINLIIRTLSGIGGINAALPVRGAIVLVLISMGLTLLAGLIPSRMAAKKDPVVALRTE